MKVLTSERIKRDIIGHSRPPVSPGAILLISVCLGTALGVPIGIGCFSSVGGAVGTALAFVLVLMLGMYIHRQNFKDNAELVQNGNYDIGKVVCVKITYYEDVYTYRFSDGTSYSGDSEYVFVAPDSVMTEGNTYYTVKMPITGFIMAVYGASEYTPDESINECIK